MGKLMKVALYVFALIGALVSAASGYVYATHTELVKQFWNVRNDVQQIPDDRRKEVIAELPARITFEREVREDMSALPDDRQAALYEQLAQSREQVFKQFAERIRLEAEIARKSKDTKEASRKIVETLGKLNVGVSLQSAVKPAPRPDPLEGVEAKCSSVADARDGMRQARQTSDSKLRVQAAVGVLVHLDELADEILKARKVKLTESETRRLTNIVRDAKETLYSAKQTPGLDDDAQGMELIERIPPKLN